MQNSPNFDHIRSIIIELAKEHNEDIEKIKNPGYRFRDINWQWNYTSSSQQLEINNQFSNMAESIRLYDEARKSGDLLAAKNGILMAKIASQTIGVFFDALASDLATLLKDSDQFQWPEFPDPYEVPEIYNYKVL